MRRLAFSLLLLSLSPFPAGATVTRVGFDPHTGENLTCLDSVTGLEWARVDRTLGLTFNEIQSGAGGFTAAGWRYASTSDLQALLARYASTAEGIVELAEILNVRCCQGNADGHSEYVSGMFDDGTPGLVGNAIIGVAVGYEYRPPYDGYTGPLPIVETTIEKTLTPNAMSPDVRSVSFLVRTAVPEPGTAALLALGISGLGLGRRWRDRRGAFERPES